jgi:hypothetical protein
MENTRRLVIASVLGILAVAGAAASDFVFGSFWSAHAMLTSLVASLLVLAVTVAIISEVLERRARRRWRVLGQYVLFELVQSARATWIGLIELAGLGAIEAGSTDGLRAGVRLAGDVERLSQAMARTLADPQRRHDLRELVIAVGAHSRALIAGWAPLMVDAGPYGPLFDRHVELNSLVSWIAEALQPGALSEWLPLHHEILVRSSVAAEHATQFDDDWLRGQLVAAAQLAVGLDFESRALGFKLVSFETWQQRLRSVELDLHELDEPLPATLAELRRH